MTPNKEDYLKMIFELGGDTQLISNKQIVIGLDVSAASVSEMITKLVEQHYVTHTPYQGIKLTATGQKRAALLVRNHRLWEVFLVESLHYPVDSIHQEAERLEHATTQDMADRLAEMLGHPQYCPHGGVIPDADGHYFDQSRKPLSNVKVGEKGHIERVVDEVVVLDYIRDIDLQIEDHFTVVGVSDSTITLHLTRTDKDLAVDRVRAAHIFIDPAIVD
ncbi:metal-dependent transcriptional regulator [Lacticaseibacillus manihotivorans]|jgi:DtxR family Mn-dependent transcriptional regulator|nr:metal-dependent transcriptional regulator [Lacticaseibacillus manihotivorans]QFQ90480.1 metal-dependent transcriptional regulator [Lacticaseibacillus manihotivorans]